MDIEKAKFIIESEKQKQTSLSSILSTSKAGVWVQIKYVYAVVAEWIFSQWEGFRKELETLVNTQRWATTAWYIEKAKEFQRGDMLELLPNGQFGYKTIDEDKRVIKQAAIDIVGREFRFKVATEKDGELERVEDEDMTMFTNYINQIKRPGTPIRFINYNADLLAISLKIYFDGELIEADVHKEIVGVIKDYLKNLVFNGLFSVTKLIDQVQTVAGVTECIWKEGKCWISTISDTESIIDRHRAASGYFKIGKENNKELLNLEMIREI